MRAVSIERCKSPKFEFNHAAGPSVVATLPWSRSAPSNLATAGEKCCTRCSRFRRSSAVFHSGGDGAEFAAFAGSDGSGNPNKRPGPASRWQLAHDSITPTAVTVIMSDSTVA